ncbi:MAG: DUF2442 domain-containing protein [Gemmatimonadetes bacterium]|nr:DUF2442 domain-containing protein [Gemmatimonadota bacterium]
MLIHVIAVGCAGPRALRVWFDDNTVKDVDLSNELWGEVFEPLHDPDFFKQVFVNDETRTVEWPNGADVAPTFLYEKGVAH